MTADLKYTEFEEIYHLIFEKRFENPYDRSRAFFTKHKSIETTCFSRFLLELFKNSRELLEKSNNDQLAEGLKFIIRPGDSDLIFHLLGENQDFDCTLKFLDSNFILFEEVFENRCDTICVNNESGEIPAINDLCFMWWEYMPILEVFQDSKKQKIVNEKVIDILEAILNLKNLACKESALHGLGTYHYACKNQVSKVFLKILV